MFVTWVDGLWGAMLRVGGSLRPAADWVEFVVHGAAWYPTEEPPGRSLTRGLMYAQLCRTMQFEPRGAPDISSTLSGQNLVVALHEPSLSAGSMFSPDSIRLLDHENHGIEAIKLPRWQV
jgi:hypothetical protein